MTTDSAGYRRLAQVGCCAYLRVYEPVSVLPDRWRGAPLRTREEVRRDERRATLAAALGRSVRTDLAYVQEVDDLRFVAPVSLQARRAVAYEHFVRPLAPVHAQAFVPEEALPTEPPESRIHILTSPWNVPIRWYLLFEDTERRLMMDGVERELTYATTIGNAKRRLGKAMPILQASLSDTEALAEAVRLASWLEGFNAMSRVELDYGGLVDVLDDAELRSDRGAQDTADSVDALRMGDGVSAGQAYLRVVTKWRRAASVVLAG